MKIPDGVNQKTLSVEAIKDKKCLILRCNKVQWIAWIIKNESYYLGYNYRCSKHINKVIPVNHSRLNRSVHQLNQLLSICMHMKYLFSIEFYNIEIFHFYLINSHLTSWFSTTNFWKFLGYDVDKDLVCAHKGVVGCREPPRKVTVKDHIIWFRIAFRQITKGRQTNYCKRQGPSEMTQHLTLGSL